MKILLISPLTTLEERYGGVGIANKVGHLPPIGLLQIAAVLEEGKHEVRVLDLSVLDSPLHDIKNSVANFSPQIVCFTILSLNASKAFAMSRMIDELANPLIVFGGPHALALSEKIIQEQKHIDVLVIGEGEYAMLEIADAVQNKKSFHDIKGICFRDSNGNIIKTAARSAIKNLDQLPFPAYHLLDINKYVPLPHHYKRLPAINVITSRGCPWGQCTFCFESLQHCRFRRMSPQKAVGLIKMLMSIYGIREISFWDDLFTLPHKWVYEFCGLIKKENLDIKWSCYAKVDSVDLPILKSMAFAGCWNIFYGLESGNQDLLDKIKKGTTLEQAENAIRWSKQAGIETRGAFMFALPGETPAKAEKTIKFAKKLNLDYLQFSYTTPYYGTELYKQCSKEGRLDLDFNKYSTFEPVYLPEGYSSKEELTNVFKRAYRKAYLRPRYIIKKISTIRTLSDLSKLYHGFKIIIEFIK